MPIGNLSVSSWDRKFDHSELTYRSFQEQTNKMGIIREAHNGYGSCKQPVIISRPKKGPSWTVVYKDHTLGKVKLVGIFNDKGIFTGGTLTFHTSEGIKQLNGAFQHTHNSYELIDGTITNIYTKPGHVETDTHEKTDVIAINNIFHQYKITREGLA